MNKIILIMCFFCASAIAMGQNNLPKIFSGDQQKIYSLRSAYLKGELKNDKYVKYLKRQADKILDMIPASVTYKEQKPPSGDKHDYMSMGKYWWPNPDTKDGLPYIRKDGEVNPEAKNISDAYNAGRMISSVELLSTAFYVTNESKYSAKANQLLRVWLLDEKTRMNPNLEYAQFAAGKNEGTKSGIIDLHSIYRLVDAIGLLENSIEWTKEDDLEIRKWFEEYLNWLRTSKNGIGESTSKNNHGSWYDVQIVSISLFLNRKEEARQQIETVTKNRIASQIKEDGKQPAELARTNGMSYTLFNLKALFELAVLGNKVGANIWNYKGEEGASIRKALDYFLPFVDDPSKWEYKQIIPFKSDDLYPILVLAQNKYDYKLYADWREKIFGDKEKITIANFL